MSHAPDSTTENEPFRKWLTGGWAISGVVLVFLVIAFYIEEDWRGEAYWKQAQEDIAAQGESLDPDKFVPPPVPDEENFGVLPIFHLDPDPASASSRYAEDLSPMKMKRAFSRVSPNNLPTSSTERLEPDQLPYLGKWSKGEQPDLSVIKKRLADLCHRELPTARLSPNASLTDMFGLLCPAHANLRAAAATHPLCRFEEDYTSEPAFSRQMGGITSPLQMAQVLSYEERLSLLGNQPQLVLDDLRVGWKVDSGVRQEPLLIAGLISMGVVAIQMEGVREGLAEHAWNDQQLEEIDNALGKIDYLKESQFCIRGDTAVVSIPTADYLKEHRLRIQEAMLGMPLTSSWDEEIGSFIFSTGALLIPNGWFDDFKADNARFHLLGTVRMVDPALRRVFPEKEARALRLIQDARESSFWRDYLIRALEPMLRSVKRFAYTQTQIDEARIACRLERYRLAHGKYPDALGALMPVYGADLPHDVMNGQLYHYKPLSDGTYLLYSVGWDQIDDGGRENVTSTGYHYYLDDPDWVWVNHPDLKKSK